MAQIPLTSGSAGTSQQAPHDAPAGKNRCGHSSSHDGLVPTSVPQSAAYDLTTRNTDGTSHPVTIQHGRMSLPPTLRLRHDGDWIEARIPADLTAGMGLDQHNEVATVLSNHAQWQPDPDTEPEPSPGENLKVLCCKLNAQGGLPGERYIILHIHCAEPDDLRLQWLEIADKQGRSVHAPVHDSARESPFSFLPGVLYVPEDLKTDARLLTALDGSHDELQYTLDSRAEVSQVSFASGELEVELTLSKTFDDVFQVDDATLTERAALPDPICLSYGDRTIEVRVPQDFTRHMRAALSNEVAEVLTTAETQQTHLLAMSYPGPTALRWSVDIPEGHCAGPQRIVIMHLAYTGGKPELQRLSIGPSDAPLLCVEKHPSNAALPRGPFSISSALMRAKCDAKDWRREQFDGFTSRPSDHVVLRAYRACSSATRITKAAEYGHPNIWRYETRLDHKPVSILLQFEDPTCRHVVDVQREDAKGKVEFVDPGTPCRKYDCDETVSALYYKRKRKTAFEAVGQAQNWTFPSRRAHILEEAANACRAVDGDIQRPEMTVVSDEPHICRYDVWLRGSYVTIFMRFTTDNRRIYDDLQLALDDQNAKKILQSMGCMNPADAAWSGIKTPSVQAPQ